MIYLELVFDKNEEVNLFDTNLCQFNVDRFKLAEKRLIFELEESRLLKIFLQLYEGFNSHNLQAGYKSQVYYNYYIKQKQQDYLAALRELNSIIDRINSTKLISISDSLKLKPDKVLLPGFSQQLNDLHYIFELQTKKFDKKDHPELANDLWKMNNLIHKVEGTPENKMNPSGSWHMVAHLESQLQIDLKPEDYASFVWPEHSGIYLNYGTLGKNLFDCFFSDDIELIRNKAVKQQAKITNGFIVEMSSNRNIENQKKEYHDWLISREVGRFIDLKNPIYQPGYLKLAHLIDPVLSESDWPRFWDYNYSLAGIRFF